MGTMIATTVISITIALAAPRPIWLRLKAKVYMKIAGRSDENEYWLWAIAAVLVLLAAETLLAQRFGHYSDTVDEAK